MVRKIEEIMALINFNTNVCDKIANELIIHLTKECPNACSFCIDKMNGFKQHGKPNFKKIKETFAKFKDKIDYVTITGGEPLLYINQVLDLVKFIKINSPQIKIVIDTSIPIQCYDNFDVFYAIIHNVDTILMSGHHYDKDKADIIRGSKSLFDREKFYQALPYKDKFIVSINVFKPYMCEKQEILDTVLYFNKLGFSNIKLAELFHQSQKYISIGQILDLKLKRPFAQGCSNKNVDISKLLPDFKGNLTIKTVCFIKSKNLYPNIFDFIKIITRNLFKRKKYFFGVIHPDGEIYPYWI